MVYRWVGGWFGGDFGDGVYISFSLYLFCRFRWNIVDVDDVRGVGL